MNRHERETYDDMLDADGLRPSKRDAAEDARLDEAVLRIERLRGLRAQREQTLGFAKMYLDADGPGGRRERACLDVVAGLNLQIAELNRQIMRRA